MRALLACLAFALPLEAAEPPKLADTFAMKNLVAWCIVPFDSQKRTPRQRVEMLQRLGFTQFAYDWRAEHLPSFPEEIELLKKAKISLKGVWFPASVGKDGEFILNALKKADVKTELWVMLPQPNAEGQENKVKQSAKLVKLLAQLAAKQDCKIGIYNHGGWSGEPENMIAIAEACNEANVGIVYNMHHGHSHLPKLDEYLKLMKPYLYCVNLNGMDPEGEKNGNKISVIGCGPGGRWLPEQLSKQYDGMFGILGHTSDDVEDRLHDNLTGLAEATGRGKNKCRLMFRTVSGPRTHLVKGKDGGLSLVIDHFGRKEQLAALEKDPAIDKLLAENIRVYVGEDDSTERLKTKSPISGSFTFDGQRITFTPRFPFEGGLTYTVIFDIHKVADETPVTTMRQIIMDFLRPYSATFTIPKPTQDKPTTVESVFPTSSKLPENALRMYVHFSSPMKQGLGQKHIQLTCDGTVVVEPYLHVEQELWSADGKRLTILFDPARVKRGLKPREEAGPILVEGRKHTLTIDAAWPDANGFPLKDKFTYSFDVGPPDDQPIDPAKWTITPPVSGIMEVKFEKPLDKALSERLIWLVDDAGKRLELPVQANKDQTGIAVGNPSTAWKPGKYKLVIDTRLEDICGNRVGEAFEVDEFKPVTSVVAGKTVEREFTVK